MIQHDGLTNAILGSIKDRELNNKDIALQYASMTFDSSVFETWSALLSGAQLVLRPSEIIAGELLANLIQRHKITTLMLTPSVITTLIGYEFPHLRVFASGGEACSSSLVKHFAPGRTFLDYYGPTEITITCLLSRCNENDKVKTIGRPLRNYQVFILDNEMQPVPIGVAGELYIGGVGVARGYINQPDLTAERFIKNPFSKDASSRLYKTGDLVRYLSDGRIEYLGRVDFQVKLRGQRIELEEIESVIRQHSTITGAVVAVKEDSNKSQFLVGYITPDTVDTTDLKSFLSSKLASYMIPSVWMKMQSFHSTRVERWIVKDFLIQTFLPSQRTLLKLTLIHKKTWPQFGVTSSRYLVYPSQPTFSNWEDTRFCWFRCNLES